MNMAFFLIDHFLLYVFAMCAGRLAFLNGVFAKHGDSHWHIVASGFAERFRIFDLDGYSGSRRLVSEMRCVILQHLTII